MTSKGEQKIEKLLTDARLNFKREYIFPDLYGYKKTPLRFDFAVFDDCGDLEEIIKNILERFITE